MHVFFFEDTMVALLVSSSSILLLCFKWIYLFFLSFSHTLIMNSMSDCRPDKNSHHQPSPDVSELDQARREIVSIQKPEFLPPSEQKMIEMIRL